MVPGWVTRQYSNIEPPSSCTNGGLIGEAYLHGMNLITEAVRQIRGTAVNQVEGAEVVSMSSGANLVILSQDRV